MTKKLVWRLGKLPSPDEVRELVKDKIISQEEAREILFTQEDEKAKDLKSLESEIKFLRDLVDKLSQDRSRTVQYITQSQPQYARYDWYQPYVVWSSSSSTGLNSFFIS